MFCEIRKFPLCPMMAANLWHFPISFESSFVAFIVCAILSVNSSLIWRTIHLGFLRLHFCFWVDIVGFAFENQLHEKVSLAWIHETRCSIFIILCQVYLGDQIFLHLQVKKYLSWFCSSPFWNGSERLYF